MSKTFRLKFNKYSLEPEIKYLVNKKTMERILDDIERGAPFIPEPVLRDERTNFYYDTPEFELYALGFECRRRRDGSRHKFDLKTPHKLEKGPIGPDRHGVFLRREYREVSDKKSPSLKKFFNRGVKALKPVVDSELNPLVKGLFQRARFSFSPTGYTDSVLEAAFENGRFETIDGKNSSKTVYLIELELKSGDIRALIDAAQKMERRYGLEQNYKTKGEMGIEFAIENSKSKPQSRLKAAGKPRKKRYQSWSIFKS
jgi:inorganic triphosphatase YgiF